MPFGFTAACCRISQRAIPALLSMYKIDSVHQLPSTLKGEVLFIKALIQYLNRLSKDIPEQNCLYPLSAAVKLFSLRFSNPGTEWLDALFDSNFKVDCSVEEQMFDDFIGIMFKVSFKREQLGLFRNADEHFNGFDVVSRALKHRSELLRLQLLQCYAQVPPLQEVTKQHTQTVNFLTIGDSLFEYLHFANQRTDRSEVNASQFNRLQPWIIQTVTHDPVQHFFLKSALSHLEGCIAPPWLKRWMYCGIIKLVMQSMNSYPPSQMVLLDEWKMSYAAYLFCKAFLFKQGRGQKKLAVLPLFGINEVESCLIWQNALTGLEKASQDLIKANLDEFQHLSSPMVLSSHYRFYPLSKERAKQLDNRRTPKQLYHQPH